MRFRILGPLDVRADPADSAPATPRAAKLRTVLATLLVRANDVVPFDTIVDELWGDSPPRTATTTLQVYVSQLRKLLRESDPEHGGQLICTHRPGYTLKLTRDRIDTTAFEELHERGRQALERREFAAAAEAQRQALAVWRGDFLADTPRGPLLESTATRLAEQRMAAFEQRVRADLQLGQHENLIGELHTSVAEHPLREELHGHLMVALYRSGRQADALRVFARVRALLVEELGVEPGAALQRLHQRVLSGEKTLLSPSSRTAAGRGHATRSMAPTTDPAFTGRRAELAQLQRLLVEPSAAAAGVIISGPGGVGKSALAAEAALRCADAFPDGLVHLDLHPGRPLSPADALSELRRLGGTRDRRVLLLLDGAVSDEQVRALLPTGPGSGALVTMRRTPTGPGGAASLPLGPLTGPESRHLIEAVAGPQPDDEALAEIVTACGRLPLLLRAVATRMATRPRWSARRVADRLRDEQAWALTLRIGELDVPERLLAAYRTAPDETRRAFRLLALLPAEHFPLWAAAAVLDVPQAVAESVVEDLVAERLLETADDDASSGPVRYRFDALLRPLAARTLAAEEDPAEAHAATGRMCAAYAAAVEAAGEHRHAWFAAERSGLAEVVATAHRARLWEPLLRLVCGTSREFEAAAAWEGWAATHRPALGAARRLGDPAAQARVLCSLGDLCWQQGELGRARSRYDQARALADQAGSSRLSARARVGLADVALERGAVDDAGRLLASALAELSAPGAERVRFDALRALAVTALASGRAGEARGLFAQCADLAAGLRDRRLGAYARRAARQAGAHGVELRPGVWRLTTPRAA
ncbi:BTAD domain-containing putative transcriptional regulator [Streptomyces sp. E11-3]|uniref:AfsR/SARP family transcriptional regulator n=1 Tax=Streptomyces sp. E11-3 TaxID=3110112 RepID=UPI00398118CC